MSFEAKYNGICGSCSERIRPGDLVQYVEDELASFQVKRPKVGRRAREFEPWQIAVAIRVLDGKDAA